MQGGQGPGNQVGMTGQLIFVVIVDLTTLAVIRQAHSLEILPEANGKQLVFVQLSFGEPVPQLTVHFMVGVQRRFVMRQVVMDQGIGQRLRSAALKSSRVLSASSNKQV